MDNCARGAQFGSDLHPATPVRSLLNIHCPHNLCFALATLPYGGRTSLERLLRYQRLAIICPFGLTTSSSPSRPALSPHAPSFALTLRLSPSHPVSRPHAPSLSLTPRPLPRPRRNPPLQKSPIQEISNMSGPIGTPFPTQATSTQVR